MKNITFNPTISFDGIAILTACVGCSIWFGTLKETVRQQGEAIKHHDQVLQVLSENEKAITANISALTMLVNERTNHKP